MKLEIRVGVDFKKLANEMPKIIDEQLAISAKQSAEKTKEAINSGSFESLTKNTMYIRKEGLSPNSGYKSTLSSKPLIHTGSLEKSIQAEGNVLKFNGYGGVHLDDGVIARNGFTNYMYAKHQRNLSGARRPKRDFLRTKPTDEEMKNNQKKFINKAKKALRRKTPLVLKS
ncbi:MAG: hypothetical protein HN802_02605 [Candidatus Jacksonbacteria bacterium]|jgi:RNase adaptor protein for sRNA GlmZ degradation|nr:hypothetical protein [Candidatus Jacksonbacteria bacterium]